MDKDKLKLINPETLELLNKYEVDMKIRELSEKSIYQYLNDIHQWLIYVLDNQGNQSVKDLTDEDITEFLYYCKLEGNNSRRMKRRMSSISAFYKFLRKKRLITENPMEFIDRPKKDTDVVVQTFLSADQVELMRDKLKEAVENDAPNAKELQLFEAVQQILWWVQTGFEYEYDEKVWGYDRAFYPEETLFYPYADSEDRSILLARLVRDVVGIDVVLIYYSADHLAAAVDFTDAVVVGDFLKLEDRRFIICDPSYIGGHVGETMPTMKNSETTIIQVK